MKTNSPLIQPETYEDRICRLYPDPKVREKLLSTYRHLSALHRRQRESQAS